MKKIILLVAVAAVTVGTVFFAKNQTGVSVNNENQALQNQMNNQESQKSLEVSTSTISQSDSFYNISASYPQFTVVYAAFNDEISSLLMGQIADFKQEAKDNWDARNATLLPGETASDNPPQPFDFIASWTPEQINGQYVSFVENIYFFTGGAHGINEVRAFNYDVVNQKEITISDFFGGSQQSLQVLSGLSKQKIESFLQANGVQVDEFIRAEINSGAGPTEENFQNFNFTSDALMIFFQQYQVAPGAAGEITITFDKKELEQAGITSTYLQ